MGSRKRGASSWASAHTSWLWSSELWECLKPKPKSREELDRESRPMLPEVEDVADVRPDLKDEKF